MIILPSPDVVVAGLTLPECPRWHDGVLYFSDIAAGRVYRLASDDRAETIYADENDFVGGIGFLENGDLLAVLSKQRALVRVRNQQSSLYADLKGLCRFVLNDMVVVHDRAYVSQPGFDIWAAPARGMPDATDILLADGSGKVEVAAAQVQSPNGMAVSPDGRTLYVSECTAMKITCFDIDPDTGGLSNPRLFAQLPQGGIPDGICIDASGAVWAAVPVAVQDRQITSGPGVIRLTQGGEVTHVVPVGEGRRALACVLGGTDRRDLYVCTVPDFEGSAAHTPGAGQLERVRLDLGPDLQGAGVP